MHKTEAQLEHEFIEQLKLQGYEKVEVHNYDSLLDNFKIQFEKFNAEKLNNNPLSVQEWKRVFNHILDKKVFDSAKILRDKYVLERDNNEHIYLSFIDSECYSKNIFQVIEQTNINGKYENIYDVVILINGLPLIHIELKRSGNEKYDIKESGISEAFNQINRYKLHSHKGLFRYTQLFVISDGVETKYYANSDKLLSYKFAFYWTDKENKRINRLNKFSEVFFNQEHIINMISKYMILNETDEALMIMRPYQVHAVEAIINHIKNNNENGYVWHTTGSGKTLTSFKTAQLLSKMPNIKKVIFLVDRRDLDSQTIDEFNKFEPDSVDVTNNTNSLVKKFNDITKNLIVSTIQKMSSAINNKYHSKTMDMFKNENVVFIIDECHRTQFGEMHKDIKKHFNNAIFIGFTGTPRFEINGKKAGLNKQTTEQLFGQCLHMYLIKNAINDGNVLGFKVDYVNTIKDISNQNDQTIVDSIDTNEALLNEKRLTIIANNIIDRHKLLSQNKYYSSIFTVQSVEAAVKYYNIFKKIDHDLNITAIFTFGQNENLDESNEHSRDYLENIINDYNEMFDNSNYSTNDFKGYHYNVSRRLKGKYEKKIDILIVVNMFLTGFDSKYLSILYVDKNLEYHDLIQAYSRTNRVESDRKTFGRIVCYRNLKNETDEALELFSNGQYDSLLIPEYCELINKINELIDKLKSIASIPDDIDNILGETEQHNFIVCFKDISKYVNTLKTYLEFNFQDLNIGEQEYSEYQSKYFSLYHKTVNEKEKVSILNDIDFQIDIVYTDKINVDYIEDLIKDRDVATYDEKFIWEIKNKLNNVTDPKELKKSELLKRFLNKVNLNPMEINLISYETFKKQEMDNDIINFANGHNLEIDFFNNFMSEYLHLNNQKITDYTNEFYGDKPYKERSILKKDIEKLITEFKEKYN